MSYGYSIRRPDGTEQVGTEITLLRHVGDEAFAYDADETRAAPYFDDLLGIIAITFVADDRVFQFREPTNDNRRQTTGDYELNFVDAPDLNFLDGVLTVAPNPSGLILNGLGSDYVVTFYHYG